ncbi:MAG: DNA gyrase inhibitor YacG [Candidatus Aenigmatarchaeota archaeon]
MKVKCPTCKKEVEWKGNPYRPFCSERCKLIDLGKWLDEEYAIEGEKVEDEKINKDSDND